MENKSEIIIYKAEDGSTAIDVQLREETVWLNLMQMAHLFQRDKSVISRHITNIFNERELIRSSTVANFATVQMEGERTIERNVDYFNLDVIISVGYRVKSKQGTQFRIWANQVLKEFLVKGYALNEKRLKEQSQKQLLELQRTVKFIQSVAVQKTLTTEEASGLLNVIADYTLALDVLDQFDHEQLKIKGTERKHKFRIDYPLAKNAVDTLRAKFKSSDIFGMEKDDSFKSSLNTIYQTFTIKAHLL